MAKLVLAGVPEQVNIPISICRERGIFEKHGLEVEFRSVPEGTGKMLNMIEEGEVDVALTVADATIIGCAKGRPLQICGAWVNSPLVWAIAGARKKEPKRMGSNRNGIVDLSTYNASHGLPLRFGISRPGSGSQSMAQYCCMVNQLQPCELQFEVANDFKGLREGVTAGNFDAFMWEVFTTKPWFDREELSYLGEVPTPWPAFVFTSQRSATEGKAGLSAEKAAWIKERLFPALYEGMSIFVREATQGDKNSGSGVPPSIQRIMREYGHTEDDARLWMSRCRYAENEKMAVSAAQLAESVRVLQQVGVVPGDYAAPALWSTDGGGANPVIMLA